METVRKIILIAAAVILTVVGAKQNGDIHAAGDGVFLRRRDIRDGLPLFG